MHTLAIDINCDLGESYGNFVIGNDEVIFPYITSCNIACGFHGGDPLSIEKTIQLALQHQVQIGAHPAFPDLMGFGRQVMHIPFATLKALLKYQISAVKGMVEIAGGTLRHVKPHGALYQVAAIQDEEAICIAETIATIGKNIGLLGMADSAMEVAAAHVGIPFIREAFADRGYGADGKLLARRESGAVLESHVEVVEQVLQLVLHQQVITSEKKTIPLAAQSLCIHGDHPTALASLQAIEKAFEEHKIKKKAFSIC